MSKLIWMPGDDEGPRVPTGLMFDGYFAPPHREMPALPDEPPDPQLVAEFTAMLGKVIERLNKNDEPEPENRICSHRSFK